MIGGGLRPGGGSTAASMPTMSTGGLVSRQYVVEALYATLLGRQARDGEAEYYLRPGVTLEQTIAWLLASPECQLGFYRNRFFDDLLAPDPLPADVPRLYVWHLPKTGGTSLREMLRPHFAELEFFGGATLSELFRMSQYRLRSFRVIAGHFGPTLPQLLPDVPLVTATLLREPVEMVCSHYVHWRDQGNDLDPLTTLARRLSFDEWCRAEATYGLWSNPQATSLCLPRIAPSRRDAPASPEGHTVSVPWSEIRERAAATLEAIDVVGTTGDVLAVYRACLDRVGAGPAAYTEPLKENVGAGLGAGISASTRDWLLEHNTIDLALYERANARAEELHESSQEQLRPSGPEPVAVSRPAPTGDRSPLTSAPPPRWTAARVSVLALLLSSAIAAVDAALPGVSLVVLLTAGPCCAMFSRRMVTTVVAGLWSFLLAVIMCVPDGIWGTATQGVYLAVIALVSVSSVRVAALLERSHFQPSAVALLSRDRH
jgi:hypothetical protein